MVVWIANSRQPPANSTYSDSAPDAEQRCDHAAKENFRTAGIAKYSARSIAEREALGRAGTLVVIRLVFQTLPVFDGQSHRQLQCPGSTGEDAVIDFRDTSATILD